MFFLPFPPFLENGPSFSVVSLDFELVSPLEALGLDAAFLGTAGTLNLLTLLTEVLFLLLEAPCSSLDPEDFLFTFFVGPGFSHDDGHHSFHGVVVITRAIGPRGISHHVRCNEECKVASPYKAKLYQHSAY